MEAMFSKRLESEFPECGFTALKLLVSSPSQGKLCFIPNTDQQCLKRYILYTTLPGVSSQAKRSLSIPDRPAKEATCNCRRDELPPQ